MNVYKFMFFTSDGFYEMFKFLNYQQITFVASFHMGTKEICITDRADAEKAVLHLLDVPIACSIISFQRERIPE
jgi:hypothetical protein